MLYCYVLLSLHTFFGLLSKTTKIKEATVYDGSLNFENAMSLPFRNGYVLLESFLFWKRKNQEWWWTYFWLMTVHISAYSFSHIDLVFVGWGQWFLVLSLWCCPSFCANFNYLCFRMVASNLAFSVPLDVPLVSVSNVVLCILF